LPCGTFQRNSASICTGPKSSAGHNHSSKNARKHNLTAPPLWEDVTKWLRFIPDGPDAAADPMVRDDRLHAAFRLAEAEAQLERCQQTKRAHLLRTLESAKDDFDNSFKDTV